MLRPWENENIRMTGAEKVLTMKKYRSTQLAEARAILAKAQLEKRDLTGAEEKQYNLLDKEIEEVGLLIEVEEGRLAEERGKGEEDAYTVGSGGQLSRGKEVGPGEVRIYRPGEEKRYIQDEQRRHTLPDGIKPEELSLGRALQAALSGDWSRAQAEQRVMATAPDSGGGYLVPAPLSAGIIGLALNKMKVRRAGALFTPMESKTLTIGRVDGMPIPEWLAENEQGNFSDTTLGAVVLTAKKLMVLTSMSIELAEDGKNVDSLIEQVLADAIALEFDRAALVGDGTGEMPMGVMYQPNVQELPHGGPLVNYSPFSQAYYMLESKNETATGLIMPPRCFGDLDLLTAEPDGQYLKPPASWENYKKYSSNQIPTDLGSGTDTAAFMGDWTKLLWGIRTEIRIEATRATTDAFRKGQVWIRAYMRGDVALARPAAFVKITGIAEAGDGNGE